MDQAVKQLTFNNSEYKLLVALWMECFSFIYTVYLYEVEIIMPFVIDDETFKDAKLHVHYHISTKCIPLTM